MWTGRERIQWRVGLEQGTEWPDGSLATPVRERRRKNLASTKGYTATKPRMQMRVNPSKFNFPTFLICGIKFAHLRADAYKHGKQLTLTCAHTHTHVLTYTHALTGATHPASRGELICACTCAMQSAARAADKLHNTTRHSGSSVP